MSNLKDRLYPVTALDQRIQEAFNTSFKNSKLTLTQVQQFMVDVNNAIEEIVTPVVQENEALHKKLTEIKGALEISTNRAIQLDRDYKLTKTREEQAISTCQKAQSEANKLRCENSQLKDQAAIGAAVQRVVEQVVPLIIEAAHDT